METWEKIESAPGYEASNQGRIRRATAGRGSKVGKILAQQPLPAGYLLVSLQINKRTATRLAHRLVAEAFLGRCPDGLEVNHKDSSKSNNHIENLEYVTRSQNLRHAVNETGAYRGERNSQAQITAETVRAIRHAHANGMGYKRLAKYFGLSWGCVRSVATRQNWKHID